MSVHASLKLLETHVGVDDGVLAAKKEHSLFRVPSIRNLFVPQRVGRPVEVPLQEVSNAELGTDEVLDDEVQTLRDNRLAWVPSSAKTVRTLAQGR